MDVDEDSDQSFDTSAWALIAGFWAYAIRTNDNHVLAKMVMIKAFWSAGNNWIDERRSVGNYFAIFHTPFCPCWSTHYWLAATFDFSKWLVTSTSTRSPNVNNLDNAFIINFFFCCIFSLLLVLRKITYFRSSKNHFIHI